MYKPIIILSCFVNLSIFAASDCEFILHSINGSLKAVQAEQAFEYIGKITHIVPSEPIESSKLVEENDREYYKEQNPFSNWKREDYLVVMIEGKLYRRDPYNKNKIVLLDTRNSLENMVWDETGIYAAPMYLYAGEIPAGMEDLFASFNKTKVSHSFLANPDRYGKPVLNACVFQASNGVINFLENATGHYQTDFSKLLIFYNSIVLAGHPKIDDKSIKEHDPNSSFNKTAPVGRGGGNDLRW